VNPLPPKIMLEMILPEVLDMERELLAFNGHSSSSIHSSARIGSWNHRL